MRALPGRFLISTGLITAGLAQQITAPPPPAGAQGTFIIQGPAGGGAPGGGAQVTINAPVGIAGPVTAAGVGGVGPNSAAAERTPEQRISVEGRVVSSNGQPINKATVRLMPANLQITGTLPAGFSLPNTTAVSTDDTGAYKFDNVLPGNFQILAERNGFVAQRYGAHTVGGPGTPLNLKDGDRLTKLDIVLTPQSVITGQVLDQDGEPVAGVAVKASRYAYTNGQRTLRAEGTTTNTDDRGVYRISGLIPGRYYVQATTRPQPGQTTANVPTFFPNSPELRAAAPVDIDAGAELSNLTIRMRREQVYSVRGQVLSGGAPMEGVSVLLLPQDTSADVSPESVAGFFNQQVRTDRQGKFEVRGVLPGAYLAVASQSGAMNISLGNGTGGMMMLRGIAVAGGAGGDLTGRAPVTLTSEDVSIVIPLGKGDTIAGRIRVENGTLEDLTKALPLSPQLPQGALRPPGIGGFGFRITPTSGVSLNAPGSDIENGGFALADVAPGKYYAILNGLPQGYYVKSMTYGGLDLLHSPLDLSNGGGGQIDVVVAKGAGDVSGTVADSEGHPMSGATVSLWPRTPLSGSANNGVRTAATDQNGSFKFANISPDEYRLMAFEELPDNGLAQYVDFLNGFSAEAKSVKLDAGGSQSQQLTPPSAQRVRAEVAKLP